MYGCIVAFLIGNILVNEAPSLPSAGWLLLALLFSCIAYLGLPKKYRYCIALSCALFLGSYYAVYRAQPLLNWHLPSRWENQTVTVRGVVSSLPESDSQQTRFEFNLQSINNTPQQTKIRLAWYQTPPQPLIIGATWQLQVRLKQAHSLLNPGGFDYEQWLFSHGIRATGYVISGAPLHESHFMYYVVDRLRQSLQQRMQQALADAKSGGAIIALVVGIQNGITPEQWQTMRATGTNHLMAIAGVHIGFVGGFAYFLVNFLWRRAPRLILRMPASQAAAMAMLLSAIVYSALAGFSLPTQRALVMLWILLFGLLIRRPLKRGNSLAFATVVVLGVNPFTTLTVSFWLSFTAVFAIMLGTYGRLRAEGIWWKYGQVQWVITLGLLPVSIWLFQQASLVSFIANLIAVPAVGFLVLPLCFIGTSLLFVYTAAGVWMLALAAKIMTGIFGVLAWLAHLRGAVWQQIINQPWLLATTVVGVLLLMAPRGLFNRWLGFFWLLPLLFYQAPAPKPGELWLTLLDVGQGLAAVVRTSHHSLVFDTGPPMGITDAGQRVILPFLQTVGVQDVDMLMVSHGDSDHIGGAQSLLQGIQVKRILTSVPERLLKFSAQLCLAGQTWQWDGVTFQVLYPTAEWLGQNNNSSCVLRVSVGQQSVLLTGDIEKPAENFLVHQNPSALTATVLIAPHHGSRTSSSPAFIQAVNPRYVLFPVGYQNRYHFPSAQVMQRYQQLPAQTWLLAETGAISLILDEHSPNIQINSQRQLNKKIYHYSPSS